MAHHGVRMRKCCANHQLYNCEHAPHNHPMLEFISFFTQQELDHHPFEEILSARFSLQSFVWVNDFDEFRRKNQIDKSQTYIAHETSGEDFRFYYSVYASQRINLAPVQ